MRRSPELGVSGSAVFICACAAWLSASLSHGQNFAPFPTQGWEAPEDAPPKTVEARPVSAVVGSTESSTNPPSLPPANYELLDGGELVAVVGEEYILAGDLMVLFESQINEIEEKAPKDQVAFYKEKLMRQALEQFVQSRLLAQHFINEQVMGKPLNEREDARKQMELRITQAFHESVVPHLMEQEKVDTPLELDQALRKTGTSLNGQFRVFKTTAFAQEAIKKHVPKKFEVHLDEMREYYEEHVETFRRPARAKFRELVASYAKCSAPADAQQLIAQMGNEVYLGGATFESVAKRLSHGPRADEGGRYDWVRQGSLKSTKVDEVVFSIPLKRLSMIIEDTDGLKIVEVLEREPARTIPFEDAQVEIRQKISDEKKRKAREALLEQLKQNSTVWSKWSEDLPDSRPLSELSDAYKASLSEGSEK
jgi:parvulin-like peptidyl-prolyl isomerase